MGIRFKSNTWRSPLRLIDNLLPLRSTAQSATPHTPSRALQLFARAGWLNLETAVGQARVGCQGVRWQGATTQRANARKEEQRSQRAPWRLNRACSAFTHTVSHFVDKILGVHGHLQRKIARSTAVSRLSPGSEARERPAPTVASAVGGPQGCGVRVLRSSSIGVGGRRDMRMVISGRIGDVCAELDRMAAQEQSALMRQM